MNETLERVTEEILKLQFNYFPILPFENMQRFYRANCYELICAILEYFNINEVSSDNTGYKINYKDQKFYVDFSRTIPPVISDKLQPKLNKSDITRILQNNFAKQNLSSWFDRLKIITNNFKIFWEDPNLKACLFLDLLYETIAINKEKQILGSSPKSQISKNILSAFEDYKFFLHDNAIKKILAKSIDSLNYGYYHPYFKTLYYQDNIYKKNSDDINDDINKALKLNINRVYSNGNSVLYNVVNTYCQYLDYRLNPKEDLVKLANLKGYRKLKNEAKNSNIQIGNEYIQLYTQMGFLYLGEWLCKAYDNSIKNKTITLFINYVKENINDKEFIYINTEKLNKLHHCNVVQNVTFDQLDERLNPQKIFPANNTNGNTLVDKKRILQYMLFSYYHYSLERFLNAVDNYSYNNDNKLPFLSEIFRIGYLLQHSTFFKVFHYNALTKLMKNKNITVENINPSFYKTTLALYLLHSPNNMNSEEINNLFGHLDLAIEQLRHVLKSAPEESLNYITQQLNILSLDYPYTTLMQHLALEADDYLKKFLHSSFDDEIWKDFDRKLKTYYKNWT